MRQRRGELGRLPGRRRAARGRGGRGGGRARGARRGRGADPVRRRHQHLRQPRAAGRRDAPGHLARPLAPATACSTIDPVSRLARVQAGVLGPDLERQLAERGWTLGHFPDSFTHSTLGGWIATRSSGMQSDRYGDIAELTRAVRVVTPSGMLATRPVPATSTGPSVREMVLGSEGRLGVITEATVHVRRAARRARDPRLPVPDLGGVAGGDARHRGERGEPVGDARVGRLRDARSRSPPARTRPLLDRVKSRALRTYLTRRKGFDVGAMCLSFIGYEGTESARRRPAQADRRDRLQPRRRCASARHRASSTTRRSSTRPTSATSCSTAARSPTCPRRRRRGARSGRSTTR